MLFSARYIKRFLIRHFKLFSYKILQIEKMWFSKYNYDAAHEVEYTEPKFVIKVIMFSIKVYFLP